MRAKSAFRPTLTDRLDSTRLGVLDIESGIAALNMLWLRGGYPDSFFAADDRASFENRKVLMRTLWGGNPAGFSLGIPSVAVEPLLVSLARGQASALNVARIARALQIDSASISRCIDLLARHSLVRRLAPFRPGGAKRPPGHAKVYLRDSGLVHALLGIRDFSQLERHALAGASWEGFVIENLFAAAPEGTQAGFHRSANGDEMDLVLALPGRPQTWAIEIKRNVRTRLKKGFHRARADLGPDRCYFIHGGDENFQVMKGVEGIGLEAMVRKVSSVSP